MLNKSLIALSPLALSVLSFYAMAHEGHDHSHPSAGLIHLLWAAPVFVIGAYASYKLRQKYLENRDKDNG